MQGSPSCASAGAAASSHIADMIFSIAAAPFGIGTQARTLQVRYQLAPGSFGRNQTRSGRLVHGRSSRAPAGPVELPQKWAVRLSRFDVVLANFNLQLTRVPQTAVAGSISPDNFSGDTPRLTFLIQKDFSGVHRGHCRQPP
jgi:hypothetical protein